MRVLDDAPVPTNGLVRDVRAANFALVLNLDELDVGDEAKHFDNVPNNLVCWDRLDKLDLIVGLEIGHLVFNLADDLEVGGAEHELHVDVNRDGDLAHRVLHEQDHASLQVGFEVDAVAVLDEERHFALVVRALQINVTRHEMRAAATSVVLQALIDLYSHN